MIRIFAGRSRGARSGVRCTRSHVRGYRSGRYAPVGHPRTVDRIAIGPRRDRRRRQRIHVAAVLDHGEPTVDEPHRFEPLAPYASEQRIVLVGHLGAEARRFVLLQHVDIHDLAVGRKTDHHADHAAEAVLGRRLHGITRDVARRIRRRIDRDRQAVDRQRIGYGRLEGRQHLVERLDHCGGFRTGDRLLGDPVHDTDAGRGDERDRKEHRHHIKKRTFHPCALLCLTPKRRGLTYLLIRGTAAFMMRIAKDMPSG